MGYEASVENQAKRGNQDWTAKKVKLDPKVTVGLRELMDPEEKMARLE